METMLQIVFWWSPGERGDFNVVIFMLKSFQFHNKLRGFNELLKIPDKICNKPPTFIKYVVIH